MRDSQARANSCNAPIIPRNEQIMPGPYSERALNCLLGGHHASLGPELLDVRLAQSVRTSRACLRIP
jgi:hypothetical protein